MLDCWFEKALWQEMKIQGWEPYALKEKLKHFKNKLKEWNFSYFGNVHEAHKGIVDELNKLDKKEEVLPLNEKDFWLRLKLQEDF